MRYSLVVAACGILACAAVLAAPQAVASMIYNVDYTFISRFGWTNVVSGSITTDRALGALQPQDILGWDVSMSSTNPILPGANPVTHGSADRGGTLTWTPFLLTPFFFGFALHRRCIRVLHFEPIGRTPGTVGGILALRDNAFEAELAGMGEYGRAVALWGPKP